MIAPRLQTNGFAKADNTEMSVVEYDLSAILVKANTTYEQRIGDDWLLFAPDWPGWPVLVDDSIHYFLDQFKTPSVVGSILSLPFVGSSSSDLSSLIPVVSFLEDSGFLRGESTKLPYERVLYSKDFVSEDVSVWLHLTNSCNLGCKYCFVRNKDAMVMQDSVSDSCADKLAQTAIKYNLKKITIKFAGGEPTLVLPLVKRFRKRLEKALSGTDVVCHTALLSNGMILDDEIIDFLSQPNSNISISLDGYGDFHDIYRRTKSGAPTWSQIVKNIDLLQKNNIRPFIMGAISEQTRSTLPDLVRWVLNRGMRTRLSVVRQLYSDSSTEYGRGMAQSFEDTFRMLERERIPFDPRSDLQICELHFDNPARGVPCGIGLNHLVIKPDGNLVSCPMVVHDSGEEPGDDLLEACRRTFSSECIDARSSTDAVECLLCHWYPICAGGCPMYNEMALGYTFAKSPMCIFYKAVIPSYLEFFGRKLQEYKNRC